MREKIELISEHELNKIVGEAKKQEESKAKSGVKEESAEEFTEFYSASTTTNANPNPNQERLTVDDLAAELQEIQVIEKQTEAAAAAAKQGAEIAGTVAAAAAPDKK